MADEARGEQPDATRADERKARSIYPEEDIVLFIGHGRDSSAEALALKAAEPRLQKIIGNIVDPTVHKKRHLEVFVWDEDAESRGGQPRIDEHIDEADLAIFVLRKKIGEICQGEFERCRLTGKPLLAFFADKSFSDVNLDDAIEVANWTALVEFRESLTDGWDNAQSDPITPTKRYKSVEHFVQLAEDAFNREVKRLIRGDYKAIDGAPQSAKSLHVPALVQRFRAGLRDQLSTQDMSDEFFLEAKGFVREGRLTLAGNLFFLARPMNVDGLDKAFVQCTRYVGPEQDAGARSKKIFEGDLISQLDGSLEFILNNIDYFDDFNSLEDGTLRPSRAPSYPEICIREVIANAICHRDYTDRERAILVRIFSDRIEVLSPGSFVGKCIEDMTPLRALRSLPRSRNAGVAHALAALQRVEMEGSGIINAVNGCRKVGAPEPEAFEENGYFVVRMYPRRGEAFEGHNGGEYDVFISYAHRDEEEHGAATELANALREKGLSVWFDKGLMDDTGDAWHSAILRKLQASSVVVALWSRMAVLSPICQFEGMSAVGTRSLMPFELEPIDEQLFLADNENARHFFNLIRPISRAPYDLESAVPRILAKVEELRATGIGRALVSKLAPAPPSAAQLAAERINLPGVLTSGSGFLAGRDAEESLLFDAWASCTQDVEPAAKTNIVVLHAIGGAGKTALMRRLVDRLAEDDFPHADKVLGWSAYSQGSGENRNADSDTFIIDSLRFMGELGELPNDAVARARMLVARLKETRTLVLLDGIEPLQSLPDVDRGRLKDKGLQRLIQDLALGHPGLVVITSRQHLPELEKNGVAKPGVKSHALDRLSTRAGAHLLRHLGCWGRDHELEAAVEEAGGHALSITLLGTYIDAMEAGDIGRRDHLGLAGIIDTPEELAATEQTARLAKRAGAILAGYIRRFEALEFESKGRGEAERLLLSVVGLFDRPADGAAVNTLLKGEPIPGLTDASFEKTLEQRHALLQRAKARLRELKLLAAEDDDDPDGLDAHPVVREHFAKALRDTAPEAFTAAHERLYRHYAAAAPDLPDTLPEMTPLFHAIGHARAAGRVQEAFHDIYWRRVQRGNEGFINKQLGAHAADLGALAAFFDPPWATPNTALTEPDRGAALNYAAFALRALARLREAEEAQAAGLALRVAQEDWTNAAIAAGNVSDLRLALGRVGAAVEAGAQAVAHADRSGDAFLMMALRTTHAGALAQAGAGGEAAALFADAEARQAQRQPDMPRLYSLPGYQYCDLLLTRGAAVAVRERAGWMSALYSQLGGQVGLLDRGLASLANARAHALIAAHGNADLASAAAARLDEAVAALRAAGSDDQLPLSLLARAGFHTLAFVRDGAPAHLTTAAEDLAEVEDIASRGGMRLYLTDWRLESARLCLAQMPGAPPQALVQLVEGEPKPDDPWPDLVRPWPPEAQLAKPSLLDRVFDRTPKPTPEPRWRDTPLNEDEQSLLAAAETHTREAAALIEEAGYHRRDRDLEDLRQRIDMLHALG